MRTVVGVLGLLVRFKGGIVGHGLTGLSCRIFRTASRNHTTQTPDAPAGVIASDA
jgi:hypothetical protein